MPIVKFLYTSAEWQSRTSHSQDGKYEASAWMWNGNTDLGVCIWRLFSWSNLNDWTCVQTDNRTVQTSSADFLKRLTFTTLSMVTMFADDLEARVGLKNKRGEQRRNSGVVLVGTSCLHFCTSRKKQPHNKHTPKHTRTALSHLSVKNWVNSWSRHQRDLVFGSLQHWLTTQVYTLTGRPGRSKWLKACCMAVSSNSFLCGLEKCGKWEVRLC